MYITDMAQSALIRRVPQAYEAQSVVLHPYYFINTSSVAQAYDPTAVPTSGSSLTTQPVWGSDWAI